MKQLTDFENYLLGQRRYSSNTARAYISDLEAFIAYIEQAGEESFAPQNITFSDLRSYVMVMVERGDSTRSVNRHIASLKSFFRLMLRQGEIEHNPTLRLHTLKTAATLPDFIPADKMSEITRALLEPSDDYQTERDSLVVLLLYSTGIRREELSTITEDDIDLSASTIKIHGKGNKERIVPLLDAVREKLEHFLRINICKTEKKHLFLTNKSEPMTGECVYTIVRRKLSEMGLTGKLNPHRLRHTFATHLLAHGAAIKSIQELLGHASLASTQIYTHNTIEALKQSYIKAHPRAAKRG